MARNAAASSTGNTARLRKTKLCRYFEQGECTMGDACTFAHSIGDLQSRPNWHKTQFCLAFQRHGHCRDGADCKYAHGDADLEANVQQLGDALPKPIGLQASSGYVATVVMPVPVRVPVPAMMVASTSLSSIRGQASGTSAWPQMSVIFPTKDKKLTHLTTQDDPDTPSTTCPSPLISEGSHTFESASSFSNGAWDRQISEASLESACNENWLGQLSDRSLEISVDHDESQMPEIQFHKSNSVNHDPAKEAGSLEAGVALDITLHRTKFCKFHQQGFCKMGRSCKFAHDLEDLRSRPNLFRTNLCFAFSRGCCKLGDTCKYAHGPEHLQGNPVQDFDNATEFQVSQFDMAEPGRTEKKTMRSEIVRALLEPTSSKVADVGTALGVQITVKNTFVHFNLRRVVGQRRSASCER